MRNISTQSKRQEHLVVHAFDRIGSGSATITLKWTEIVANWGNGADAVAWAESKGVSLERLGNTKWLSKRSILPPPDGIGESLTGLLNAIRNDPRFQVDSKGDFSKFQKFIGLTTRKDSSLLVSSWKTGQDALNWAAQQQISFEQLGNCVWLATTSALPSPAGIGKLLGSLLYAIKKDPRFQIDGKGYFSKFQEFIGHAVNEDHVGLISSWNTGQDAIDWATKNGISFEQLGNAGWLQRSSSLPPPEGIGKSLNAFYNALRRDPRFQTDGKSDFDKFRAFIVCDVKERYVQIVSKWKNPQDALDWASQKKISIEQLSNAAWLMKTSANSPPEGIGESLVGLYIAISKDIRFRGDGKADFTIFQRFLGRTIKEDYSLLLSSWKTSEDVLTWAAKKGIGSKHLTSTLWLQKTSKLPPPEGIGESLNGLYKEIVRDPRFQTGGKSDFNKFKIFLGHPVRIREDYALLVASWNTRQDVLDWADKKGILIEQLGSSKWLHETSPLPRPKGIGEPLCSLFLEIKKDPRFQTNGKGDFVKFQEFIGIFQYSKIVSLWRTPQDAKNWATSEGISETQLTNSRWQTSTAAKSIEEGGINKPLSALCNAINRRFGSFADFRIWLSGRDSGNQSEIIKELFSGPEAAALRNLANCLGEAALAEYLVAAYPDKFQRYGPEIIENLRPYLGELEKPPSTSMTNDLPEELFLLDKLSFLRQAFFNYYRDLFQPEYTKGLNVVTARIENEQAQSSSPYQKDFFASLIEYYRSVDALPHPSRLKESLHDTQFFPAGHQMMAMFEVSQQRRLLLADEMGGGKTGSAIGSFELLRDQGLAKHALIICPAKVVSVWRAALSNDTDGYFKDLAVPSTVFIDSDCKDWAASSQADYTVISLEMLRSKTDGIPNIDILKTIGFDFLIFDEAHNAKSIKPKSSDTERVFAISQIPTLREGYTLLLSGTPIPNTLRDLAAHIRLLYSGTDQSLGVDDHDIQNLAKQILNSHPLLTRNLLVRKMMRRKTEDCLPVGCEYHREVVMTDFDPVTRARYAACLEDPFLSLGSKIAVLRRYCMNAKFNSICAAVNKALGDEKYRDAERPAKIVIAESAYARGFTRNTENQRPHEEPGTETYVYSRLCNYYGSQVKVFVLDGKNSRERKQILKDFSDCKQPAILLTLVSVSGEGLNITCAADAILASPTYTVSSEEQYVRRFLRFGQKLPVRLQVLCFSGSIEEGIASYSARKHRAVASVIDGRPLNKRERSLLADDFSSIKVNGPIAYESLTPRQQALWILNKLKGLGKQEIQSFLYADDGKYAKDFARGYPAHEETSVSGNTARLVTAIIGQLVRDTSDKPRVIADIACGCRTLERMFEGEGNLAVRSVDVNEVALITGSELLRSPKKTEKNEVRAMDNLPFDSDTIDIGVISLALDMTQHSSNKKREKTGLERIETLMELNRVLRVGGKAILTFQESLFSNIVDFNKFLFAIEEHFGFKRLENYSGLAQADNNSKSMPYAVWIMTLEKHSALSSVDANSLALWKDLRFPSVSRGFSEHKGKSKGAAENKSGAYQDTFLIGEAAVRFEPSTMHQIEAAAELKRTEFERKTLGERVQELLRLYPNIGDIAPEMLLSITPRQVSQATQHERDKYYRLLIDKYGSEERIPTEEITSQSSYILIRRTHKTKGDYLCLAKLGKDGKSWVGFHTRYFYQEKQK
jgi:superfamily II DNA or RNA helicase